MFYLIYSVYVSSMVLSSEHGLEIQIRRCMFEHGDQPPGRPPYFKAAALETEDFNINPRSLEEKIVTRSFEGGVNRTTPPPFYF